MNLLRNFKILLCLAVLIFLSGCTVTRIDTKNIDSMLNVILKKNNTLFNSIGQGYKYYLPGGVSYIENDEANDILYCDGVYYYLYINAVDYYYKKYKDYKPDSSLYYSRKLTKKEGFTSDGYLEIRQKENKYYVKFLYNYAKIETVVSKEQLNKSILNSTYILSTVKYNHDIIELMLNKEYFTNKTGKFDNYNTKGESTNFVLEKNNKEG